MFLWEFQVVENPFFASGRSKLAVVCYLAYYKSCNPSFPKWTRQDALYNCIDRSVFGPLPAAEEDSGGSQTIRDEFAQWVCSACCDIWSSRRSEEKLFVGFCFQENPTGLLPEPLFSQTQNSTARARIVEKVIEKLPHAISTKLMEWWRQIRCSSLPSPSPSPVTGFLLGWDEYRAVLSSTESPMCDLCRFVPKALVDIFQREAERTTVGCHSQTETNAVSASFWGTREKKYSCGSGNDVATLFENHVGRDRDRVTKQGTSVPAMPTLTALQKSAVHFYLLRGGRSINASEMGTGKTATAVACADFTVSHSPFLDTGEDSVLRASAVRDMFRVGDKSPSDDLLPPVYPRGSFWKRTFPCQFVLVISPASVKTSWTREFERFAPRFRCIVLKSSSEAVSRETKLHVLQSALSPSHQEAYLAATARAAPVDDGPPMKKKRKKQNPTPDDLYLSSPLFSPCAVITSFASVATKEVQALASNALMVIVDESHSIKNASSKRTKAVQKVVSKSPHVYLLSGTPGSKCLDLVQQLRAVSHTPSAFAQVLPFHLRQRYDEFFFGTRYCLPKVISRPGYGAGRLISTSNVSLTDSCRQEELHVLLGLHAHRIRKEEALPDLPAKHRQRSVIHTLDKDNQTFFEKELDKISDARDVAGEKRAGCMLMELVRKTASLKIPYIQAHVSKLVGDKDDSHGRHGKREKILFFGHHIAVLEGIQEQLGKQGATFMSISGKTPAKKRQHLVDDFQGDRVQHAVLSIQAAGTGLNLFKATRVVVCELIWSDQHLMQAEDRAHRRGVAEDVVIEYLVVKHSTDDLIWRSLSKKSTNSQWMLDNQRSSSLQAILLHRHVVL